jgi:general secretion pathway protein F
MDDSPHTSSSPQLVASPARSVAFAYRAQTDDGDRLTGTIEASDAQAAMERLAGLRLRVTELSPLGRNGTGDNGQAADGSGSEKRAAGKDRKAGRPLRGDDFIAFNQQMAQLAASGMPIESGLRLIARDLRKGRLARTVQAVADELDRGTPLGEAFERHGARFPPLYGRLLDAGVRAGDLPAVLLNLGRHMELVQRLRAALWRTLSYPLVVLVALALVLSFLGFYVLPQFAHIYEGMRFTTFSPRGRQTVQMTLPAVTEVVMAVGRAIPFVAATAVVLLIGAMAAWAALRARGRGQALGERVALSIPLIGRAVRASLVARWCDALRIGVSAGMPLPAAIELAADAVRSPMLRADGRVLAGRIEAGVAMGGLDGGVHVLPATVPAALDMAAGHNDLPATLASLADLYERQAEARINAIPAVLTPILVIVVAGSIGFVILGFMLPMVRVLDRLGDLV